MMRFFTVFTFILLLSFNSYSSEHLTSDKASERIEGAAEIWIKTDAQLPSYIRFDKDFELRDADVLNWLKDEFSLPEQLNLVEEKKHITADKTVHTVYSLTFSDTRIEFARIIVHSNGGMVKSINGNILKDIAISNTKAINEKIAIDFALDDVQAAQYKWHNTDEEDWLKEVTGDKNATFYPQPELVLLSTSMDFRSPEFRYAYRMNVYASEPYSSQDLFIDAENGQVLMRLNALHEADSTGLAHTGFSGIRQIQTDHLGQWFYLREYGRGNGIHTWDLNQGTDFNSAVDFRDEDNNWIYNSTDLDAYATDAHWGIEMTYDYMKATFGRNSIDDNGFALNAYVHYGEAYNNARWDSELKVMMFGDGPSNLIPLTTLDIVGHEIGHGLTQFTAGLIYQNESGALNESFSDILGNCVEYYGKPGQASWRIGEDRGSFIRDMSFPNAKDHPDTYKGDFWYVGSGDNGGVHINSGVQNHWFYLLSDGGNGVNDNGDSYNMTGIGIINAALIAYRSLEVYLLPLSDYEDASFFSTQASIDLFGNCSPQHEATVLAWNAVGLNNNYIDYTVADFEADKVEYCNIPFTIEFTNSSVNGESYNWDFGDGTTSSEVNPSHTFTKPGSFTVSLSVDGGGCGQDANVKPDLVTANDIEEPIAEDVTIFRGDSVLLSAETQSGEIHWYSDSEMKNLIAIGNTYQTPSLQQASVYYLKSIYETSFEEAGADLDENQVDGQFSNLNIGLKFNAEQDLILESISVMAQSAGERTFVVRDAGGIVIFEKAVQLSEGVQEVSLKAAIPQGDDYVLSYTGAVKSLWMANIEDYPYNYSGLLSITGNTMDLDNAYPYFFNWKMKEMDCESGSSNITVSVRDINQVSLPPYNFYVNEGNGLTYYVDFFFKQNTRIQYGLYGINGQLVFEIDQEYPKGENTVDLNDLLELNSYQSGVYFITMNGGGIEETEKIVKKGGSN